MTIEQAQAELTELRGLADSGQDLAFFKERIERLYKTILHKPLRKCKCKNVLADALIEIYSKIKYYKTNEKTMEQYKAQAKLVKGVILQVENNHYTNANLTDDIARKFLAEHPNRTDWFAVLPSAVTSEKVEVDAVVEDNAEKGAEVAPKEVKTPSKATATKKKKTSSKRK